MRKKDPEQALLQAALKDSSPLPDAAETAPAKKRTAKIPSARSKRAAKTPAEHRPAPAAPFYTPSLLSRKRQTVIVCFGTMSISGDSLGPMVGTLLSTRYNIPAFVYGTENCSVNGKNMKEWLDFIKTAHAGALFIAVDASLGTKDNVGKIVIRSDGVCPAAIKGKNERFGDVGILGVVAENKGDALMQLMSVSPLYVEKMADEVALLLKDAI